MQRVVLLTFGVCLVGLHSYAHENDPYTHRAQILRDSLPVLDREVNAALKELASSWKKAADEWQFVMAVYRRLGGVRINDRLQRWALRSPEVDRDACIVGDRGRGRGRKQQAGEGGRQHQAHRSVSRFDSRPHGQVREKGILIYHYANSN